MEGRGGWSSMTGRHGELEWLELTAPVDDFDDAALGPVARYVRRRAGREAAANAEESRPMR